MTYGAGVLDMNKSHCLGHGSRRTGAVIIFVTDKANHRKPTKAKERGEREVMGVGGR